MCKCTRTRVSLTLNKSSTAEHVYYLLNTNEVPRARVLGQLHLALGDEVPGILPRKFILLILCAVSLCCA